MSVRLFFRLYSTSAAPTGQIFVKSYIGNFYENLSIKSKFC